LHGADRHGDGRLGGITGTPLKPSISRHRSKYTKILIRADQGPIEIPFVLFVLCRASGAAL
jgi:hypothetical protein